MQGPPPSSSSREDPREALREDLREDPREVLLLSGREDLREVLPAAGAPPAPTETAPRLAVRLPVSVSLKRVLRFHFPQNRLLFFLQSGREDRAPMDPRKGEF